MELLQAPKSKLQQKQIRNFLHEYDFSIIPLSENSGHRAAIYIEEYSASSGLLAGDAIIAATAVDHDLALITSNIKHFSVIKDVNLKIFKP